MTTHQRTAIVVGVGSEQGLGAALVRRFASEGHRVIVSGRTEAKIARIVRAIGDRGGKAEAFTADATSESDVVALFDFAEARGHVLDLVVFNAGNNVRHVFRTMPAELFEQTWRVATFGGFLVGREAARRLAPSGQGTIIFTGATASLPGKPPFTAFASAKAALRSLAQSIAREFGPPGRMSWISGRSRSRFKTPDNHQQEGEQHGTAKRKNRGVVVGHRRPQLSDAFPRSAANLYL